MVKAKIYTRKGDAGNTSRAGGGYIAKDSQVVRAYGTLDELNAVLGLVRARVQAHEAMGPAHKKEITRFLFNTQGDLFKLGSVLCANRPNPARLNLSLKTKGLEKKIDRWDSKLPPLRLFLVSGEGVISSLIHVARTAARRAEREVVRLEREEALTPGVIPYLNRLSDALFVLARYTTRLLGEEEAVMKKGKKS